MGTIVQAPPLGKGANTPDPARFSFVRDGFYVWGFLLSLLSAALAGTGFLWSLFDPQKRCWHDRLSRTGLYRD